MDSSTEPFFYCSVSDFFTFRFFCGEGRRAEHYSKEMLFCTTNCYSYSYIISRELHGGMGGEFGKNPMPACDKRLCGASSRTPCTWAYNLHCRLPSSRTAMQFTPFCTAILCIYFAKCRRTLQCTFYILGRCIFCPSSGGAPQCTFLFYFILCVRFSFCCYLGKALRAGIQGFRIPTRNLGRYIFCLSSGGTPQCTFYFILFCVCVFLFVVTLGRRYGRGFRDFEFPPVKPSQSNSKNEYIRRL